MFVFKKFIDRFLFDQGRNFVRYIKEFLSFDLMFGQLYKSVTKRNKRNRGLKSSRSSFRCQGNQVMKFVNNVRMIHSPSYDSFLLFSFIYPCVMFILQSLTKLSLFYPSIFLPDIFPTLYSYFVLITDRQVDSRVGDQRRDLCFPVSRLFFIRCGLNNGKTLDRSVKTSR